MTNYAEFVIICKKFTPSYFDVIATPLDMTNRQKGILRVVVDCFIDSATPVGSQHLADRFFLDLSPATIRNELAELEDRGYIAHPYTSAGRVPTDTGYRLYVDSLMEIDPIPVIDRRAIQKKAEQAADTEELLWETSKILGKISRQLIVVTSPHIGSGVLEKIELVSLSSNRVLVVLTMKSKLVKTITLEVVSEIDRAKLDGIGRILNERLGGLTLREIRETFAYRIGDVDDADTGLIRLFVYSRRRIFDDLREHERLYISGTQSVIQQQEFEQPQEVRNMMEILDNEEIIVHVLEKCEERAATEGASVTIGSEHTDKRLRNYSVVVATYRVGDVLGTIGLIGPKRMHYARIVPLMDFAAQTLSSTMS